MQLSMNKRIAKVVISSIIVFPDTFNNLREVSTTKQIPNRLEEALRMWGDLSFSAAMSWIFGVGR